MDAERHRRASEVFGRVCELSGAERELSLRAACGEDAELERDVRTLLQADERRVALLESGVLGVLVPGSATLPTHLGPFRVLHVLGEGAMGVVFEAEQESPRRRVALKVTRPGLLSPELLARFRYEAELLGRLQHPGIAQVYASGSAPTASGPQPWMAMELVRGVTLDVHARGVDVRHKLELVARVAEAVHHAHQRGIVHRDLKCANVLVDESGALKVLDFGVARAEESDVRATLATKPGLILGTLATMSPEQADAATDVDARTDVYALGAIAYELLAGRPPLELSGLSLAVALQAIQTREPPRLGLVDRALAGDIEVAVAKALEKDRDRRYHSAAALAEDLRRILRREPILARDPSTLYLASKLVRRHPAAISATALVLLAGVVGGAAYALESRARYRSEREAREQGELSAAIDRYLLRDLLESGGPYAGGLEVRVVDVLLGAADGIDAAFPDRPHTRAGVSESIARSLLLLGELRRANALARETWAWRRDNLGERHPETLAVAGLVITSTLALREVPQGLDFARRQHGLMLEVFGPQDERTLSAANDLGGMLILVGEGREACELLSEVAERRAELLGPRARHTLTTFSSLASALRVDGRAEESLARREANVAELLAAFGPDDADLARERGLLACQRATLGRARDPESELRASLPALEKAWGPGHEHTLFVREFLAQVLVAGGRGDEALEEFGAVLREQESRLGPDNPRTWNTRVGLARTLLALGRVDDAAEQAAQVVDRATAAGVSSRAYGLALIYVGLAEAARGERELALEALESGLGILERKPTPDLDPLVQQARSRIESLRLRR